MGISWQEDKFGKPRSDRSFSLLVLPLATVRRVVQCYYLSADASLVADVSYASYNAKYANAVQDAWIIVCSNCAFEVIAAFGVFAIVGFLDINPDNTPRLGAFEVMSFQVARITDG